jgi:hypothetical protein
MVRPLVLTDGTNTFGNMNNQLGSIYSSFGYLADGRIGNSSTTSSMNEKTLAACKNAKAQGIEVYTIRLEEPNVATGTMPRDCASAPENYFDVPSRSQLDEAFAKIKERIARVRISSWSRFRERRRRPLPVRSARAADFRIKIIERPARCGGPAARL